jgi:predicted enzyme related to lactoylglutathione lyase
MAIGRIHEVVIDCADPVALVQFWLGVLGGEVTRESVDWVTITPPNGPKLCLQHVPEGKRGKNRVHLDVEVDDLASAIVAGEALGATAIGPVVVDAMGGFQVMADPEGNEFCFTHGPVPPYDA